MKRLALIGLVIVLFKYSSGYESLLYFERSWYDSLSSSGITNSLEVNPVRLLYTNNNDSSVIGLYLHNTNFGYKREYDPESVFEFGLIYRNYKTLSDKNIISSRIYYCQFDYLKLGRSLEKSFYDNYFSIIDTTVGNVSYNGPVLSFADLYRWRGGLIAGFLINYGIERGLKDVYTKCETIARNFDSSIGVGFKGKRINSSVYFRYLNNQRKYEAVKEYQDALIRTFYGFHIYKIEEPGVSKKKDYSSQGWEIGGGFEYNFFKGWNLNIEYYVGMKEAKIAVNNGSVMKPRGDWVREGYFINAGIIKKSGIISSGLCFYRKEISDWAESSEYKVLILENNMKENFISGSLDIFFVDRYFGINVGFGRSNVDYVEYNSKFNSVSTLKKFKIKLNSGLKLKDNFNLDLNYFISTFDTDFRWDTDSIFLSQISIVLSKLTIYGSVKTSISLKSYKPYYSNCRINTGEVQLMVGI
ncbi:MAG: hypothetical protein H0Z29_02710 [Candidatus Marinimicrobia bacterium]|nr:hypothetical protein [Candidatus Neomarinimicrobiota bacterium]